MLRMKAMVKLFLIKKEKPRRSSISPEDAQAWEDAGRSLRESSARLLEASLKGRKS